MAATNGKVSKAEMIRQTIGENPKMKARDVVATLAKQGVKVHPNHVYLVKSHMKQRRRRRMKTERVATTTRNGGMSDATKAVMNVKALAEKLGGLKHLKALVDVLAE